MHFKIPHKSRALPSFPGPKSKEHEMAVKGDRKKGDKKKNKIVKTVDWAHEVGGTLVAVKERHDGDEMTLPAFGKNPNQEQRGGAIAEPQRRKELEPSKGTRWLGGLGCARAKGGSINSPCPDSGSYKEVLLRG